MEFATELVWECKHLQTWSYCYFYHPPSLPLTNPKDFVGKEKEVKVLTAKVNDAEKRHKMFKSPTGKQELYKTDFKIEGFFLGISKDLIFKLIFEKNLQTNS